MPAFPIKSVQAIALEKRISLLTDVQLFKFRRISRAARTENNFFFSEQWNTNFRIGSYLIAGIQRIRLAGAEKLYPILGRKDRGCLSSIKFRGRGEFVSHFLHGCSPGLLDLAH